MNNQGTNSNNSNEITEEGTTSSNNEINEEGAMDSSSTTSGSSSDYESATDSLSTTSSGSNTNYEGTTSNNNEITQEETGQLNTHERELMGQLRRAQRPLVPPPPPLPPSRTTLLASSGTTSNNIEITEDHVTVFVAYNGKWEYDRKEWSFENSKSSIMVVAKHITLSEIRDILHKQLKVNKNYCSLKLEVHYRTGSPWFPVTEIKDNQDLKVFISETSKTKLPLCVTQVYKIANVGEKRRKDHVRVLVAYNGKWRWDGEKWLFENSKGSIIVVSKYVTLSQITNILYAKLDVDQSSYCLKLEVHHRAGSPWFPIIEIGDDHDLSTFISESSKTKLPLCVTHVAKVVVLEEHGRKDDRIEKRLMKAIEKNDWVKAREIVNTEEVTWTSKLNDDGKTALHFAVGQYKNNEVVRDILKGANCELLVTSVTIDGQNPAHIAAIYGNTEALEMMLNSNPECLIKLDNEDILPIHYAVGVSSIETFRYLFEQMKSNKVKNDILFRGMRDVNLLHRVIGTGLLDVAHELINSYPRLATTADKRDKMTALECIIRKPELFYSGTSYSFYSRFVYHIVPIKNNNIGSPHTADVENQETPKKEKFVTKHKRRCLHDVISRIYVKFWETTLLHVPHIKRLKDDKEKHNKTVELLWHICEEVDRTHTLSDIKRLYSSSFCLAVENNTAEAIHVLTTCFPGLYYSEKDGQNIYQLTVLNRSEKVYSLIMNDHLAKEEIEHVMDKDHNNILHLVGRLAPIHKLNAASGATLQMQQELQWFKEVENRVHVEHTRALNNNKETPMMVFRQAHKELRKDGEEWMKKTADSYTITAALIITIVFAAAITVPGGNDNATGKPIYETKASLIIFAISDAISLFTSTTSLLLFLSILTARYADEDFLCKLPKRLIIGLVMLFVSVTSMMIAFSAAIYIMFGQEKQWILIPIGALACLPIASFVTLQCPLLVELISSTYWHGMFGKEKDYKQLRANAYKKKRA